MDPSDVKCPHCSSTAVTFVGKHVDEFVAKSLAPTVYAYKCKCGLGFAFSVPSKEPHENCPPLLAKSVLLFLCRSKPRPIKTP